MSTTETTTAGVTRSQAEQRLREGGRVLTERMVTHGYRSSDAHHILRRLHPAYRTRGGVVMDEEAYPATWMTPEGRAAMEAEQTATRERQLSEIRGRVLSLVNLGYLYTTEEIRDVLTAYGLPALDAVADAYNVRMPTFVGTTSLPEDEYVARVRRAFSELKETVGCENPEEAIASTIRRRLSVPAEDTLPLLDRQ